MEVESCEMQKADVILAIISQKSKENRSYIFQRLYRLLFNKDIYIYSLDKIYSRKNKEFCKDKDIIINSIIEKIKKEKYLFEGNKVDGINFEDEILIATLSNIIESIYEPIFLNNSHAFRPNRSHKTALTNLKLFCNDMNTFLVGSIDLQFNKGIINKLLELLSRKIDDKRFINLINQIMLKGYLNSNDCASKKLHNILINIYLHELDTHINEYISVYFQELNVQYVRYGNEYILCFKDNTEVIYKFKIDIEKFLNDEMKIFKNENNIEILSYNKGSNIFFLDYEIGCTNKNNDNCDDGKLKLMVPKKIINERLKPFMKMGKSIQFSYRVNMPVDKIINLYNQEIEKLYKYYSIADDVKSKLHDFKYYHYQSLLKTIACKEKITIKKVIARYGIEIQVNNKNKKIIGYRIKKNDNKESIIYYGVPDLI